LLRRIGEPPLAAPVDLSSFDLKGRHRAAHAIGARRGGQTNPATQSRKPKTLIFSMCALLRSPHKLTPLRGPQPET
jgi:hypothetical protein